MKTKIGNGRDSYKPQRYARTDPFRHTSFAVEEEDTGKGALVCLAILAVGFILAVIFLP